MNSEKREFWLSIYWTIQQLTLYSLSMACYGVGAYEGYLFVVSKEETNSLMGMGLLCVLLGIFLGRIYSYREKTYKEMYQSKQ